MASREQTLKKIQELEDQISNTRYNKKTQHAIGLYKAQVAKLKEKLEKSASGGGTSDGYAVKKSGDATVILVGFPSVGKSTLLNVLTNQESETANYAFTTLTCIPGIMKYQQAQIQILDVPGIVEGAASGRGRGKEVLSVMRSADLAIILIDVFQPEHYKKLLKEIYDSGLRLNQTKPDIKITKKSRDGIDIGFTVKNNINEDTLKLMLKEFRINNADVVIRSKINEDQFIDAIEDNKIYMPAITVVSKVDLATKDQISKIKKQLNPDLFISAQNKQGIEELKRLIFKKLNFIRIYCKEPSKDADLDEPLIMKKGCKVGDVCNKLHRSFVEKFKYSRIWGKSAKFPGQKQMLKHRLKDKDIVELHLD